jgi:hypothetical protein
VLARADAMADVWRARLHSKRRPLGLRRFYAPLAVTMMGAFLHSLVGAVPVPSAERVAMGPTLVTEPPAPEALKASSGLLAWRLEPERGSADSRDGSPFLTLPPGDPAASARDTSFHAAPEGGRSAGSPAPATDGAPGTTQAGTSEPNDTARHPARSEEQLSVMYLEIPRPSGDDATGAAGVELDTGFIVDSAPAAAESTQAARTVDVPTRVNLAPTQRAYVAAYLRAIGDLE